MFTSGFLFESYPLRSRAFFSEYLREGTGTWAGACRGEGGGLKNSFNRMKFVVLL